MLYWRRRFDQFAIQRRVLTGGVNLRKRVRYIKGQGSTRVELLQGYTWLGESKREREKIKWEKALTLKKVNIFGVWKIRQYVIRTDFFFVSFLSCSNKHYHTSLPIYPSVSGLGQAVRRSWSTKGFYSHSHSYRISLHILLDHANSNTGNSIWYQRGCKKHQQHSS